MRGPGMVARWSERAARAAVANPVGFFYAFRWLTWTLALLIVVTRSSPDVNLRYQPGLLMYAALQLALGVVYSFALRPRLTPGGRAEQTSGTPGDLAAMGVADIAGSLALVYFSGGWGSPFWHYAATAILVPCFLLPPTWGIATVVGYAGAYVLVVAIAGDGLAGAMAVGQRNLFIGNVMTAFLVAIAVGYLGTVFRRLAEQRHRAREALAETEMLFQVTHNVVQGGTDPNDVVGRVTQVVRTAGLFDQYAVLLRREGAGLDLAAASVGIEELRGELADRAMRDRRIAVARAEGSGGWQAALPLVAGTEVLGVMVAGGTGGSRHPQAPVPLLEAMASQIAMGVHNAVLARQKADLAADEERGRIAREIHDGISQSIYMLSLQLETCADIAQGDHTDLSSRLQGLVALSKQTLLEVRHYIFDLKPFMTGEKGLVAMIESQATEFSRVANVHVTLETSGEERRLSVPLSACLYRVTQEALANVFKHAHATTVTLHLGFAPEAVEFSLRDDGRGFDPGAAGHGLGLDNMRRRVEELGGSFALRSARGQGTEVAVRLPG